MARFARREGDLRRVERLRKASRLPLGKTLATLDVTKFPLELQRRIRELTSGAFRENAVNILAFGLPGTGKTHASCAIGNAMVEAGLQRSREWTPVRSRSEPPLS